MSNTQITSASGYNTKNVIFGKPREGSIPNTTVTFQRIPITTQNPDGTVGVLVLKTSRLFSFGLSENINMNTGKTDGYTVSLCLTSMDAPSEEEKHFLETFNAICARGSNHILEHRDDVKKYELVEADLRKFNPIYYKREKGKIVEGSSPVLYAKVLQNKKTNAITSIFYDQNGRDIDPMTLLNKQCHVTALIKFECIFIGSKVSLQIKLQEAEVTLKESGVKRLMRPVSEQPPARVEEKVELPEESVSDSESDTGSLHEEETKVRVVPPAPVKAPVRRMKK